MTLDCLVSNPLRKQMFHQDYETCLQLKMKRIISKLEKSLNNIYDCVNSSASFSASQGVKPCHGYAVREPPYSSKVEASMTLASNI